MRSRAARLAVLALLTLPACSSAATSPPPVTPSASACSRRAAWYREDRPTTRRRGRPRADPARVAAFAGHTSYHVGQSATCSQLQRRTGSAARRRCRPVPPIGQGVNAAMESAIVLDEFLGEPGLDSRAAAARYSAAWKPESDTVTWISQRVLFDNPLNTLRSTVTIALGVNLVGQAKSATEPYSEVREKARQVGPLRT